jgi:cytidylate kinase
MPHVIAIFGKSCVGKSVVAKELATALNLPVRHCGDAVKVRALDLGVDVTGLPLAEHQAIDQETRALAEKSTKDIIIEGNFLDAVLDGVPEVLFVHLICEDNARAKRFIQRSNDQASEQDLHLRDASDASHREKLYKLPSILRRELTIDTTNITIDEVVRKIVEWVNSD